MKQRGVDTEVDEQLVSAAAHSEAEREGLGLAFIDAVEAAHVRIVERPNAWAMVADGRRFVLDRFPGSVVDVELGHEIRVLAIAHAKRRPGFWHAP